ncbi:WD40-repeat-containing domain protein [Kalaharituber pfeilii]|nr:WD40-repeat-containing domain protein [Kalaharituber pfeilii]
MALARFTQPFGIGTSRPPSSSGTGPPTSAPRTTRMTSRTTELVLDSPIHALSANQEGDRVIVAGRDFLKIITVGNDSLQESHGLRIPGGNRRNYIQNEVKWGNAPAKDLIATAATNGAICIYKDGKQDRILHEHHRQVNRLAFNPADGRLLLSASQDGNVRLWDLRDKKSRFTFQGKSEAVRDVQFNAGNAVEFAAAFENGSIQRWDYRNPNTCERKINNAHQGAAYSVAWHPDGKHCASGGRDKTVKVWDFYADPRRKSKHTIYTQMSVGKVIWRPLGYKTTELATCSINIDYRIHLWDLKRPYMPSYVLSEHSNTITGLQFKDEDILFSASKDMALMQHDIVFGHQPISDLPQVAIAWNSDNEITFAAQRRKRVTKFGQPGLHLEDDFTLRAEDRKKQSRSSSFKASTKAAPQSSVLDNVLEKFQPSQATARVHLPVFNFDKFEFLARHYVTTLLDERKLNIAKACERNARAAMHVGEFRAAKSWEMLGYLLQREDDVKAEREERERQRRAVEAAAAVAGQSGPGGGAIVARRLLGLGGGQFINPGGTPLARPVPDTPKPTPMPTPVQLDNMISIDETLLLPPAAFGTSVSSSAASTDGDSSPRLLPDEDEDVGGDGGYEAEAEGEAGDGASQHATSPRPILQIDTSGQRYHQHNKHGYQGTAGAGGTPSIDSTSGPFFSTSAEGFSLPTSNSTNDRRGSQQSSDAREKERERERDENSAVVMENGPHPFRHMRYPGPGRDNTQLDWYPNRPRARTRIVWWESWRLRSGRGRRKLGGGICRRLRRRGRGRRSWEMVERGLRLT